MQLDVDKWTDFAEFREYEKTLIGSEKDCEWEQRIVNTKLQCFGKTSMKAKQAVKEIKKGNYIEFLTNIEISNHFESLVYAHLMNCIKDFKVYKPLLDKFVKTIDNWASTDTLNFDKLKSEDLYDLSKEYITSDKEFFRRVAVNTYFTLIKRDGYIYKAFDMLDALKDEDKYYVNMCGAWLLAECFAKYREETLEYFKNNDTNAFIINKGISKCRDSFRVSSEDKELLLQYKKKQ